MCMKNEWKKKKKKREKKQAWNDADTNRFVSRWGTNDRREVRWYGTEKNAGNYFIWEIMLRYVRIDEEDGGGDWSATVQRAIADVKGNRGVTSV